MNKPSCFKLTTSAVEFRRIRF